MAECMIGKKEREKKVHGRKDRCLSLACGTGRKPLVDRYKGKQIAYRRHGKPFVNLKEFSYYAGSEDLKPCFLHQLSKSFSTKNIKF